MRLLWVKSCKLPGGAGFEPVALDGTKCAGNTFIHVGAAVEGNHPATARDQVDQPAEGGLHRSEIVVDIGVIELHVGKDQGIGKVVHELRPFIEEGGIVLIALEDEWLALAHAKAGAKIFRDAADQERWRDLRLGARSDFIDPGQHAGGGGLAVSPGDHQRIPSGKKLVLDGLGQRAKGYALIEHVFQFHISAGDGVAHDHQVRARREVGLGIGLHDGDAQFMQKIRHGWIRGGIGASDAIALACSMPASEAIAEPQMPIR